MEPTALVRSITARIRSWQLRQAQFIGAGCDIPNIRGLGGTMLHQPWASHWPAYAFSHRRWQSICWRRRWASTHCISRYRRSYPFAGDNARRTDARRLLPGRIVRQAASKYEEAKKRFKQLSTPEKPQRCGPCVGIYGCGLDGRMARERGGADSARRFYDTWQDHGQGQLGTLSFAYETLRPLGLRPEQIKLEMNDTLMPDSGPSGGSRSNVFIGNSIRVGCEMLLNAMRKSDGKYRSYGEMVAEKIPLRGLLPTARLAMR